MRWLFIVVFWLLVCVPFIYGMEMAGINKDARVVIMVGVGALAMAAGMAMTREH